MIALRVSFFCLLTLCLAFGPTGSIDAAKESRSDHLVDAAAFQVDTKDGTMDFVELHRSLRFEPPEIDFGTWSVGVARSHKVTLVNENANRSVYLSSVSGRTPIFYSSFFESRVVPPLANTTFEVVFLPRRSAVSSDYLLVHTSFGQARLLVRGEGFECPYRLQPIVGVKGPLNALLTPEIYMYNPHSRPLQIVEVYSSGGQFQLELPSGLASAPQALWEIPPYTTKPIIRIRFHGNVAGNHTAYIRIKIAPHSDDDITHGEDVLVVPVEFEIFPEQGMYAANPVLDFGRLTNTKPRKPIQLNINLRNSDESRFIERVGLVEGESLITGLKFEESDGSLTLDTQSFNKTTSLDELLTLQAKSKDNKNIGPKFTVRVRAEIFKGTLHYNRNATVFITGMARCKLKEGETRALNLRNDFEMPISFLNVSIGRNDSKAIQVHFGVDYHNGLILEPGESLDLLHLQLMNISINYQSQILIITNITNFEIPLVICTGRLHVMTFNEPMLMPGEIYNTELNLGSVPLGELSQNGYIVVYNPNPITVKLTKWNFKSPKRVYYQTTAIGCLLPAALKQFHLNKSIAVENSAFTFCTQLNEGDVSVFIVAMQSYLTELLTATLQIWTPYETIAASIVFNTWSGKLEVDQEQLYFKNCFPGKLCASELSIHSTFQHPIHLTSINFTDEAIRFENDDSKNLVFALTPNAVTRLGRIYFEPAVHCHNRCYLPLDGRLNNLAFPTHLVNENNNFHFDETELRKQIELYRQMKWHFRDISFTIRSRELRQMQLQAFIEIEWPKLVEGGEQKFPNVEAGKVHNQVITIRNPTDKPLLVDFFLSDPKYAQQTKLSLPLEVVAVSSSCYLTDKHVFSIPGQTSFRSESLYVIPPYGHLDVGIRFEAPSHKRDTYCTLLHIRNNLTLYESVWVSARVVQSQFSFGNLKPGSTPLLYDLQEKHLASCPSLVLVKRSFTARNTGEVPIWIDTFLIGDQVCEGYGFKVLGCGKGFQLKTNQSRKIEIAFRPDFTASRVTRLLTIRTNLSYEITYTLHAQLPPTSLLEKCTESMQRPSWERQMRMAGLFLLLTSFVLVVAAAHVDSESIAQTQSALYVAREKGPVHPTFNLRNIAMKAGLSANSNNNSSHNGRHQNQKGSNHYLQSKSNNQHQKKRAATGAGGSHVKKYQSYQQNNSLWSNNNFFNSSPSLSGIRKTTFCEQVCLSDPNESKICMLKNSLICNVKPNIAEGQSCSGECSNITVTTVLDHQKTLAQSIPNRAEAQAGKKQKSPPLQGTVTLVTKSKVNTKGKSKSSPIQTTPPPTQNPIIELMDKEVTENEEKCLSDGSSKPMDKRTTQKTVVPTIGTILTENAQKNSLSSISTSTPLNGATKSIPRNTTPPKNAMVTPPKTVPMVSPKAMFLNPAKAVSTKAINISPTAAGRNFPTTSTETSSSLAAPAEVNPLPKTQQKSNKYGKTPGRERRKEKNESAPMNSTTTNEQRPINTTSLSAASSSSSIASSSTGSYNGKRSERKEKKPIQIKSVQVQLHKTENAQPSVPNIPLTAVKNIDSLFEVTGTQKVSLDDILQVANKQEKSVASRSPSNNTTPDYQSSDYQSPLDKAIKNIDFKNNNVKTALKPLPLIDPTIKDSMATPTLENITTLERKNQKVADLGPIGTKKSPSSTPVWESVMVNNIVKPCAPLQPKPTDSNSFFSTFMDNADMGGEQTSYDYTQSNTTTSFMNGISNADLYELRKAQAELRRQLQANEYLLKLRQQQLKEQLRMATAHWPATEEQTWTPIGFDGHRHLAMPERNSIPATSSGLEGLGRWQPNTPVRPPPGLDVATTSTGFSNGLSSQQPLTHNNNYNNNNNNSHKELTEPRAFDPFSSLSSIWSDNWKQLDKRDENGNQNGYPQ